MKRTLLLTALVWMYFTTNAFAGDRLKGAHEAYLAGEFGKSLVMIKQILEDENTDKSVRENAMELSKVVVIEANKQDVSLTNDINWTIPEDFMRMRFSVESGSRQGKRLYHAAVAFNTKESGMVDQIKVKQFPDTVVLDLQAGIGAYREEFHSEHSIYRHKIRSEKMNKPIPGGLYFIEASLRNGKKVNGWFVIDDQMNATSSMVIHSPAVEELYQTSKPTFRFDIYKSPQYQSHEKRGMYLSVNKTDSAGHWQNIWSYSTSRPIINSKTMDVGLNDGQYIFFVKNSEKSYFGDLQLVRASYSKRNFNIKTTK